MKTIVHTLAVNVSLKRIAFQIKLPNDATKIRGIKILTNAHGFAPDNSVCGLLQLWATGAQNVFYSSQIDVPKNDHKQDCFSVLQGFPFGEGQSWISGAKDDFFHFDLPLSAHIIEGFYEDLLPLVADQNYQVSIYLKLAP